MNKKTKFAILGVIALVLVTLSLTYAYWMITRTQTKENVITAVCLDISLTNEQNDISLTEQFPISDEEGKELIPYTFTVTNNCNTSVDYNINLEVLGDESENMASTSIKVMLDEEAPVVLGKKINTEPTIADAYESHLITQGTLGSKETSNHSLKLWIDEEAPITEMNKSFSSKVSITAGQGINNPLKKGTLAYNYVSQYDNAAAITTLNAEDTDIIEDNYGNTITSTNTTMYYWSNSYSYDENAGHYSLTGDLIQATEWECCNGIKQCGKYTLKKATSNAEGYGIYKRTACYPAEGNKLAEIEYTQYIRGNEYDYTDYTVANEVNMNGVYTIQDDYGISYYFRGVTSNNLVQFGTYDKDTTINTFNDEMTSKTYEIKAGTPMYWRILRINGDGTIRLAYEYASDGTNQTPTSVGISKVNDATNLGYTYENTDGEQTDSLIKSAVDDWYEANLKTNYEKYIADSIFCEDKEIYGYADTNGNITSDPTNNAGKLYNAYYRYSISSPNMVCNRKEDSYTVSSKNGNGYLTNPVGLITIDEYIVNPFLEVDNGAKWDGKYVYSGAVWLMSPAAYVEKDDYYYLVNFGEIVGGSQESVNVRPVINLKADVAFTGNGTIDSPYVITTN